MQPLDGVPVEAALIRILPNFGPYSTWTVLNSLDNADACMPLTQDCPPSLIVSTTGHYNSTGTHNTSFWLPFPASVQQRRALECTSKVLKGIEYALSRPPEMYWKPPERGHLFTEDTLDGTNVSALGGSTVL